MFRKTVKKRGIVCLVSLFALLLFLCGCGSQSEDNTEKFTTEVLGDSMIIGLKHITGELSLKELVTVTAQGNRVKISGIDQAYAFEVSPHLTKAGQLPVVCRRAPLMAVGLPSRETVPPNLWRQWTVILFMTCQGLLIL